jgi:hypothetical protein
MPSFCAAWRKSATLGFWNMIDPWKGSPTANGISALGKPDGSGGVSGDGL